MHPGDAGFGNILNNRKNMRTIFSLEELRTRIEEKTMVAVYFSSESCNVCKTLKPKIIETLSGKFPGVEMVYVDIEKSPVISGQYRVFSIPTIDVYVEGREYARFGRNLMIHEFEQAVRKPYDALLKA